MPVTKPLLNARLIYDAKAILGEGSLWHPVLKKLLWVDIEGCQLHEFDPFTGLDEFWKLPARVGTVVPAKDGGYLLALQTGIHYFNTETGSLKKLANPISNLQMRFNDGKCDPGGRFWVGTLHMGGKKKLATLYRYDPDGSLHAMLEGVTNSNGIAWTADGKIMYYIDTPTGVVQRFDFNLTTGALSNRAVAVRIPAAHGAPDGMAVDVNGHIWVALWGGGAVHCYDPASGQLLYRVTVPAPNTTSCAFGGAGLSTLYITTARQGLDQEQLRDYPYSGGLFAAAVPVTGVPAAFFG